MSLNASIVAYHTPQAELTRIVGLLRTSGMTKQIYIVDNSEAANPQTGQLGVEYHFMGRNAGYGTAHNVALRRSIAEHADYHLVVNSDITFEPDMLRHAVRFMDAHPDVALLSPRMIRPDGTPQSNGRLLPTPLDVFGRRFIPGWKRTRRNQRYELQPAPTGQTRNVPYLSGAFMLLRITALERVGLFDERFFMYPEDIDLTRRLHRHYQTLYLPTLNVTHRHAQGSYHSLKLLRAHIGGMIRYFNKWGWIIDRERKQFNRQVMDNYFPCHTDPKPTQLI